MKTRTISFIFLSILSVLLATKAMSQDGVEEKLFYDAFPELNKAGIFEPNANKLTEEHKTILRDLMQKLDDAMGDLVAFEVGMLGPENAKVFEYKKLKKVKKDLNTGHLKEIIKKNKYKIKGYMGFKDIWPDESEEGCLLAQFIQACKAKKWGAAYWSWNVLFHHYPDASSAIYSRGTSVMDYKIATDEANKEKWIDTLMMIYDQRIAVKQFGKKGEDGKYKYPEGYILGRKAIDLLKYRREAVDEAYAFFEKSIELQGAKSEDATLLVFMHATEGMFHAGKIDAAQVTDNYTKIIGLLEKRFEENPNDITKKAIDGVNALYFTGDPIPCEHLVPALEKKFEANKDKYEELMKIARILDVNNCNDCDLFTKVVAEIDKHEPEQSKQDTLRQFFKYGDYNEVTKYLNDMIQNATVDSIKAKYYYKLAKYIAHHGKKEQAKAYALKAISLKPNYGHPYILIALMYASSGCSQLTSPEIKLRGVCYWAAVDKLVEAKSVDPSVADDADKLIERYKGAFPKDVIQMWWLPKGKTVKIGCWINETTTVRY